MARVGIFSKGGRLVYENRRLQEALIALGFRVEICHPNRFAVTMGTNPVLTYDGEPFLLPHLMLSRTGSGTGSHAATILRQIEAMGGVVVNSVEAIQRAMDKIHTMAIAQSAGLPIPQTMICSAQKAVISEWSGGYPCIVKTATGSHGNGVFKCETPTQLKALVALMKALDPKRPFLVQEYLGDRPGCDLRVLVIGSKAVGAMMRSSKDDFRAGISAGGTGEKFDLTPEITQLAERVAGIAGLEITGVDLLFHGDGFCLSEVNSAPGFRGFETYCDLDVAGEIASYVVTRLTTPLLLQAS